MHLGGEHVRWLLVGVEKLKAIAQFVIFWGRLEQRGYVSPSQKLLGLFFYGMDL